MSETLQSDNLDKTKIERKDSIQNTKKVNESKMGEKTIQGRRRKKRTKVIGTKQEKARESRSKEKEMKKAGGKNEENQEQRRKRR